MSRIILASASPRRKELLTRIGIEFDVIPSTVEEQPFSTEPEDMVIELSMQKAADIANRVEENDVIIIGADTIVVQNNEVLGKPADTADAFRMLKKLSGKTHEVYTGVTLIALRDGKETFHSFAEKTLVTVAPMRDGEINSYIATGEPLDKAGAYGIQGLFARHITGINGDYFNVVGLPLAHLYQSLKMFL